MKPQKAWRLLSAGACLGLIFGGSVYGRDGGESAAGERPRRKPQDYSARVSFSETPFRAPDPAPARERETAADHPESSGRERMPDLPSSQMRPPMPMMPAQIQPAPRNWILPPATDPDQDEGEEESEAAPWDREDHQPALFGHGWGWLVEEVTRLQMEAARREEREDAREEAEAGETGSISLLQLPGGRFALNRLPPVSGHGPVRDYMETRRERPDPGTPREATEEESGLAADAPALQPLGRPGGRGPESPRAPLQPPAATPGALESALSTGNQGLDDRSWNTRPELSTARPAWSFRPADQAVTPPAALPSTEHWRRAPIQAPAGAETGPAPRGWTVPDHRPAASYSAPGAPARTDTFSAAPSFQGLPPAAPLRPASGMESPWAQPAPTPSPDKDSRLELPKLLP